MTEALKYECKPHLCRPHCEVGRAKRKRPLYNIFPPCLHSWYSLVVSNLGAKD